MKENCSSTIYLRALVIVGVFASVISFVYYFALKNPSDILLWLIYIVDFLLFTASAYQVVNNGGFTKIKTAILTIITIAVYFIFCEVVVFLFTAGTSINHTLDLFFDVLRICLFLSPSFILLIPIMMFIAEVLS